MKIIICKDKAAQGEAAASLFAAEILRKPDCVLGFATGSSPLPTYAALVGLYTRGALDFSSVRSFNLDEYVGMPASHDQSYYSFMQQNLFSKVNMAESGHQLPDGMAKDPESECIRYENAIAAAGGIDLQLLGIGHNGHIGFNEPDTTFPQATHVVSLAESTIEANKRFFASADDVPRKAITMGIGTIMQARGIVLVASGADKAGIIAKTVKGDVTPDVPASILQFHHNVSLILDPEAAAGL